MTTHIRKPLLNLYLLSCCLLATTVVAEPDDTMSGVDAQPLADALLVIAEHYKVTVLVNDELVRGQSSGEVAFESLSALEAIRLALGDTGLEARYEGETIVIALSKATPDLTDGQDGSRTGSTNTSVLTPQQTEEVVVYGEQLTRSLQDTQSSVTVYVGEQLNTAVTRDLYDLLDRTAGVSAFANNIDISIRGVPGRGTGGAGARTVDFSLDGARIPGFPLNSGPMGTWDLEQVEIFRGPQSTQSGQNALAGAIRMRSAQPSFERELKLRGDYGSHDETRLAFAGNLPLSDTFAVRLSAEQYETDGDIENVFTGEDEAAESLDTYRLNIRYQPREDLNLVAGYSYIENQVGDNTVDESVFPDDRVNPSNPGSSEGSNELVFVRADWALSENWVINFNASTLENDTETETGTSPIDPISQAMNRFVNDTLQAEIGAVYSTENFRSNLGLYYSEQNFDSDVFIIRAGQTNSFPPPGVFLTAEAANESKIENVAFFGEFEWQWAENWTLVVGARYDSETSENSADQQVSLTPPIAEFPSATESFDTDYDAFLPKLAVVHNITDDVSLGFTVQRGYRAGGAAVEPATGELNEFDPEFTNNYELSLRSQWLDGRLTANANLYYTDWTDQQIGVPADEDAPQLGSTIRNAGESELYGFELETVFVANQQTEVFLSLSYAHTAFVEFVNIRDGEFVDLSGNQFPSSPEWTGALGLSHRWTNGLEFYIKGSYTDEAYGTVFNDSYDVSDDFFIVDARFGYVAMDWTAHLYARNLFDEDYLTRNILPNGDVPAFSVAGDSQVIGISLTYGL